MQKQIPRATLPILALALGWALAACSSPDNGNGNEQSSFSATNAWAHLERIVAFGPRPSGSPANAALRDYISTELQTLGLTVTREPFTDTTPVGDIQFENLFVDLAPNALGADPDGLSMIIGTHFDTKIIEADEGGPFVGANDGGSGTAILLELARVLTRDNFQRTVPVRLLFIDGEEAVNFQWEGKDNTYGSRYHANNLAKTKQAARVGAVVILDMLGDKNLTIFHDTYSRRELMELFEVAAAAKGLGNHMAPRRSLPIKDDHLSFQVVGIPAVDLIDFEYGPQNQHWHKTSDTLENCSALSLGRAGRIFLAGMPSLERWILKQ
jgi:glutaminyl-peptide cyclotransferase